MKPFPHRFCPRFFCLWLGLWLVLPAPPTAAGPLAERFAVHALGFKVGELHLAGTLETRRYTVTSQFHTTGLAGALARVRFSMKAGGRRDGATFHPAFYVEDMDTGRRESRARLDFSGPLVAAGVAAPIGPDALRDVVDPLTAILMVLRDHPSPPDCTLRQRVFDGERLTELQLTRRDTADDMLSCGGSFRRLAGYPARDMARWPEFPLRIDYTPDPATGYHRATRIQVQTIYGPATLVRR